MPSKNYRQTAKVILPARPSPTQLTHPGLTSRWLASDSLGQQPLPLSVSASLLQAEPRTEPGDSRAASASAPLRLTLKDGRQIAYHRRTRAANDLTAHGNNELQTSLPGIVFLGGFASDMSGTKAMALDAYCAATGRAFLRFDYTGHGQSSGRFVDGTIGHWRDDALAVVDQLTEGPQILIGSSMGGWLMLLCALARPERIAGLIGLAAAPDFTEELMWGQMDTLMRTRLMSDGRVEEPSAYGDQPYVITRALIEDGRQHLLLAREINITVPVRLLHGQADQDVPFEFSLRLATQLVAEDVVVSLIKDGDHRLSRPQDLDRLMMTLEELSQ
jgi:pimeloyl-ACP methyl ester carboxylesterase